MNQFGYGSPFTAGATNPNVVHQHIANDLGYGQATQQYANPGTYGSSTFAQFGTNPQVVQQHVQQDLGYAGPSQGYSNGPANYANSGAFAQYGTSPQVVRQHIQQDLQGASGGYASYQTPYAMHASVPMHQSYQAGGMMNHPSYGSPYAGTTPGYAQGGSMLSQYGTNPQVVQSHIHQQQGYQNPAPSGYGMMSNMYQPTSSAMQSGVTNPQVVRQHIAQDLGQAQVRYY